MQLFLATADPLDDVVAHKLFNLFGVFPVTSHMLMALIVFILMLVIFPRLFRTPQSDAPTGAKNFFESILEFLRVEVFRPALKENTDRFVPYLWTLFFFILFCNLLSIIPLAAFVELITGGKVEHIGGPATGSVPTDGALAIFAFIFIHASGIYEVARSLIRGTYGHHATHQEHTSNGAPHHEAAHDLEHLRGEALAADVPSDFRAIGDPVSHYNDDQPPQGHRHQPHGSQVHSGKGMNPIAAWLVAVPVYLWNFAPHPFKPQPGQSKAMWFMDIPMFLGLLVLEMIGALVKPFALCMRLFGNMVAGHILLAVLVGMIVVVPTIIARCAIAIPIGALDMMIQLLEVFVAFLQAYIFTFLTTLFIASAVAPEH